MKNRFLLLFAILFFQNYMASAQNGDSKISDLPSSEVSTAVPNPFFSPSLFGIPTPPPGAVRTMAEWEELEAIVITWAPQGIPGVTSILKEIVRHAKEEVEVIIMCSSVGVVTNQLGAAGINTDNITFITDGFDTIWIRDYGPNTVYLNDVNERLLIDWIYNRDRPEDNEIVPNAVGNHTSTTIHETTAEPTDLVHTGGNFMTDGMGTGFSSKLILEENGPGNIFGTSNHSLEDIEMIMNTFMGIDRYVLMDELEYDVISHIDMHMKLLDEETLLVGQYPEGVADGPLIEANLQFILDNYTTPFGNEYNVIRIPMPPDANGNYPDAILDPGDYRTYTNALIVNKTILVPTYQEQYDTSALRIWEEAMPGFKIQGIDCNAIIHLLGAIHCITKEVGHSDPLLINHARVRTGCMEETKSIEAIIKHASGIESATVFFSIDTTAGYQSLPMTNIANDTWVADLPATGVATELFYYIDATAFSGKNIVRPLPAPQGYWHYDVADCLGSDTEDLRLDIGFEKIYPNPTNEMTVIPIHSKQPIEAEIIVTDILGRTVANIFTGKIPTGDSQYFFPANKYPKGTYFVNLKTESQTVVQKLIIQ